MKFDLKRPCQHCPFRTDIPAYLTKDRVEDLARALLSDGSFACHKTVDYTDDGGSAVGQDSQFCAGALLVMEKELEEEGGLRANLLVRVGVMCGRFDESALDRTSPVYASFDEMIEAQESTDAFVNAVDDPHDKSRPLS